MPMSSPMMTRMFGLFGVVSACAVRPNGRALNPSATRAVVFQLIRRLRSSASRNELRFVFFWMTVKVSIRGCPISIIFEVDDRNGIMHSIRQFELVKALATYRHFGRAAKALGVSQPSLTRSLKHLEDDLGVPLFDRQGVAPTVYGELVLSHGEPVIGSFADLMREIGLAKGLEIGELSVSAGPYPADISG